MVSCHVVVAMARVSQRALTAGPRTLLRYSGGAMAVGLADNRGAIRQQSLPGERWENHARTRTPLEIASAERSRPGARGHLARWCAGQPRPLGTRRGTAPRSWVLR